MRLETLIEENYDKLNENDLSIWNFILRNKKECQTMSIQGQNSAMCHTQPSQGLLISWGWKGTGN